MLFISKSPSKFYYAAWLMNPRFLQIKKYKSQSRASIVSNQKAQKI